MRTNNKRFLFNFVILSVFMVFTACNSNEFFNEYKTLKDGWNRSEPAVFDFESLDTVTKRDAFINIRTTSDYAYSNLFLIVKMTPPEGHAIVDTLQYQMANPDGSMLGSGFTDVKEHKLVWRKKLVFKKQGVYNIEITNAMRKVSEVKGDATLQGITEVGLQIQ